LLIIVTPFAAGYFTACECRRNTSLTRGHNVLDFVRAYEPRLPTDAMALAVALLPDPTPKLW